MNGFADALAGPLGRTMAWTLLHSLWQAAALALLLVILLKFIAANRTQTRYVACLATLTAVVFSGLITLSILSLEVRRAGPVTAASSNANHELLGENDGRRQPGRVENADRDGNSGDHQPQHLHVTDPVPERQREEIRTAVAGRATEATAGAAEPWWIPTVVMVWVLGVVVMLVRMARQVSGSRQLAHGTSVEHPEISAMLDRLCGRLGITRPIRIVSCEQLRSPAVVGVLRPALALPLSLMTGLAPDQLEAILAHELAHIRRHDYLVNLGQMLIEALWFFNPAVWWISRQVRLEREACCDRAAVQLTDQPLTYVQTLAAWAERSGRALPVAATAFSGTRDTGSLLDRVRRIVSTDYQPQTRVSWTALVVVMVTATALLVALNSGMNAVVDLAADVLSPQERIQAVTTAMRGVATPRVRREGRVTLKGTIRTEEGAEPSGLVWMYHNTRSGNRGTLGTIGSFQDTFEAQVPTGITWISFWHDDYAPAYAGPFDPEAGSTLDGIGIVLQRGERASVRVNNAQGQPVARASVVALPRFPGRGSQGPTGNLKTDEDGMCALTNVADLPYQFTITAPGYQPLRTDPMELEPGGIVSLLLQPADVTSGKVVSHEGQPVPGATIREYARFKAGHSRQDGRRGPVIATTDAAGQFSIDQLEDSVRYVFLVETDTLGRALVRDVESGQSDLHWVVGPDRWVRGTIAGNLDKLERYRDRPIVNYGQTVRTQRHPDVHALGQGHREEVRIDDKGTGHFEIHGLLPGEVVITAGPWTKRLAIADRSPLKVAFDVDQPLPEPESREVLLHFTSDEGPTLAEGRVRIRASVTHRSGGKKGRDEVVSIEGGTVRCELPVPATMYCSSEPMIGYWFPDETLELEVGGPPIERAIKVYPAGAISGKVLAADGTQFVDQKITVACHLRYEHNGATTTRSIHENTVNTDGEFFLSPIPLGAQCVVSAYQGHNVQVAPSITLDGTRPTREITLQLPRPTTAVGQVLGPDGAPQKGIGVSLSFRYGASVTHSWGPVQETDGRGKFQFTNINAEIGEYRAVIDSRRDWQPIWQRLQTDGQPTILSLIQGQVVEGMVVDSATGDPVRGVEVYAMRKEFKEGKPFGFEAEELTDEKGRFRFSNLPDEPMRLSARQLRLDDGMKEVIPGEMKGVVLRGTLYDWFQEKLQAAAGLQP